MHENDIVVIFLLLTAVMVIIIAIKIAIDHNTFKKHLEKKNKLLKTKFKITEDVF